MVKICCRILLCTISLQSAQTIDSARSLEILKTLFHPKKYSGWYRGNESWDLSQLEQHAYGYTTHTHHSSCKTFKVKATKHPLSKFLDMVLPLKSRKPLWSGHLPSTWSTQTYPRQIEFWSLRTPKASPTQTYNNDQQLSHLHCIQDNWFLSKATANMSTAWQRHVYCTCCARARVGFPALPQGLQATSKKPFRALNWSVSFSHMLQFLCHPVLSWKNLKEKDHEGWAPQTYVRPNFTQEAVNGQVFMSLLLASSCYCRMTVPSQKWCYFSLNRAHKGSHFSEMLKSRLCFVTKTHHWCSHSEEHCCCHDPNQVSTKGYKRHMHC